MGGAPIGKKDPDYSIEKKQPGDGELGYVLLRVHNVTEHQVRVEAVSSEKFFDYQKFT